MHIGAFLKRETVPLQITVHDGEEDLEEEVHGVDEDGEEVEPRFAGHGGGCE